MRDHTTDSPRPGSARTLVLELIDQTSHLSRESVTGEATLRELGFDSLRHFQLLLEIEGRIGRELGGDEVDAFLCCATVDDVCEVLSAIVEERTQGDPAQVPPSDGPARL